MLATRTPRTVRGRHPSRLALLLLGSAFVVLLLVSAVGLAGFVWPEDERPAVSLGLLGDYEIGVPVAFWLAEGEVYFEAPPDWDVRGYVVRQPDGMPLAFEARDPLQGCPLVWTPGDDFLSNPCHLNNYWLDGTAVDPANTLRLTRVAVAIGAGGKIELGSSGTAR